MKRIIEGTALHAASLHWISGATAIDDIEVGIHDLSRLRATLIFPDGASVQRDKGSEGDGYEEDPAQTVSLVAALLFIDRYGPYGPGAKALWKSCITEAIERKLKAKNVMPSDAMAALRDYEAGKQNGCKRKRKTDAKRIGVAGVGICVERMTIKDHAAHAARN